MILREKFSNSALSPRALSQFVKCCCLPLVLNIFVIAFYIAFYTDIKNICYCYNIAELRGPESVSQVKLSALLRVSP